MSKYIAHQIADDYGNMMMDGNFGCPAAANEHLLDVVQGQSIAHVSNGVMDTYTFRDNSSISFKGNHYRVGVGWEVVDELFPHLDAEDEEVTA